MSTQRFIDYAGGSDEDVARLRLLLRKLAPRLPVRWTLGPEARAELVLVDLSNLAGEAARQRAVDRGVGVVAVRRGSDPEPQGVWLPLPLREDDLHALLAGVGLAGPAVASVRLIPQGDEFFNVDIEDEEAYHVDPELLLAVPDSGPRRDEDEVDHDAIFRRDDMADSVQMLLPDALDGGTEVERVAQTSARSAVRAARGQPGQDPAGDAPGAGPGLPRRAPLDEGSWPLRDYLLLPIVRGPSRIELAGLPPLVIDPKRETYQAPGPLSALELYCMQPLRRADWHPLSTAEIAALHADGKARPWRRLLWMDRLLTSGGRLDPHFDRAGSFRITRWLDITQDFPRHARIAAAMMQPRRLHEIAAVANAPMGDVFDTVNAFEAIGDLVWEPKVREEWESRMGREEDRRRRLQEELDLRRREVRAEDEASQSEAAAEDAQARAVPASGDEPPETAAVG